MAQAEADPRRTLRKITRGLATLREQLQDLLDTLPRPPEDREDETPADLRSQVECVLTDSLDPALRNLSSLAAEPSGRGDLP
ncbi:MAG: hypothetical protein M3O15_13560 [Acidobacteriota bacterium]|nr:hypothetical protein [Acidobacteriota bacterium]